jgi:hypothetical protein
MSEQFGTLTTRPVQPASPVLLHFNYQSLHKTGISSCCDLPSKSDLGL